MALIFDEAAHSYTLDGRTLVSVTRVLRSCCDDQFYTPESRDRGSRVHRACLRIDENRIINDPIAEPYLTAYERFRFDLKPAYSHLESPVHDALLGYAGTLDRAGIVGGQLTVLDIKTGQIPPMVGPQTAAYRRCLLTPHEYDRAALLLRADGTYRYVRLTDRADEAVFLAALTVWHWKQKYLQPEPV